jgi:5,10-methenyltetrahydrofolate synthetase
MSEKSWPEISAWRRQQRERLIALRVALPPAEWRVCGDAINAQLRAGFSFPAEAIVGFCWPFKNEFDARFAIRDFRAAGVVAALPVVVDKAGPLQFRKWWPGAPMKAGVYGIPYPDGTELVMPDAAIVPMNGFDEQGCRLGYGGGYFDRTLAAQTPRPVAIGVGFEFARLPTIYPQPHDIAMDFVVTEAGIHVVTDSGIERIGADDCRARLRQLLEKRGLPRSRGGPLACYSSPPCYAGEFPGYFGETDDAGK